MRARRPCTCRRLKSPAGCRTGPRKCGGRTPLGRCPLKQPGLISECCGVRDWSLAIGRDGVRTIHRVRGRGGWRAGVDLPQLPFFLSASRKEVGDTSLPYLEINSHPSLHNGLTRLAGPLHRSAGEDRQRAEERVDRNLQGYPHEVSERSRRSMATTEL